ncbi:FimV/HubP family polar landmark protein [Ferrimonas gelatinilytica]
MTNKTLTRASRIAALGGALVLTSLAAQTLTEEAQVSEVAEQPLAQYGPTTRTDTLWRIANQVRPDSEVTIYQVMQALYNANPHAFTSSNFNSLERNRTLTIPAKSVMLSQPATEAMAKARQHDQSWKSVSAADIAESLSTKVDQLTQSNAELNERLAAAQAQVTQQAELRQRLREELAVKSEEANFLREENTQLKSQVVALENELNLLRSALDDQQGANRDLAQELDAQLNVAESPVMDAVVNEPAVTDAVVNEPTTANSASPWSAFLADPMKVAPLAAVPLALLLAVLLFWRRRSQSEEESSAFVEEDQESVEQEEAYATSADRVELPLTEPSAQTPSTNVQEPVATERESEANLTEVQPKPFEAIEETAVAEVSQSVEMHSATEANEPVDEEEKNTSSPPQQFSSDLPAWDQPAAWANESDQVEAEVDETELSPLARDAKSAELLTMEFDGDLGEARHQPQGADEKREVQEEIDFDELLSGMESAPATADAPIGGQKQSADYIDIDELLKESDLSFVEDAGDDERESMIAMPETPMNEVGVSAKLDLARAYIEIDDKDSARALLKEVSAEGSDGQRGEAQTLLNQL